MDYGSLPAPEGAELPAGDDDERPETPTQRDLSRIWGHLLDVRGAGIHTSFFDLGGHSLLAAQLIAEVRQRYGVELPIRTVFDRPTIAALAEEIDRRSGEMPAAGGEVIPRASRSAPLPLSFVQETLWYLHHLSPWSLAYNFQFTLRLRGRLNVSALQDALSELVRRHEIYRTTFPATDGTPVQVVHPPSRPSLPLVTIDYVPPAYRESEGGRLIREECQRTFNPWRLPLVRWKLLRLQPDDHILIQVEHHLVHDGWSLAIQLRELRALYNAFCRGEASPLPDPELQWADFAVWQRLRLSGALLEDEIDRWKARLSGGSPLLEVPTDRPRPAVQGFAGARLMFELPADVEERLQALARHEEATLFMVLLAGFNAVMSRYSGLEDIVIGSGFGNRTRPQTEGIIGPLVNTVVLRTSTSGNPTFRQLIRRTRLTVLDASDHQELPFEKLVAAIQPDRDLSHNPLFNVAFSFHDAQLPRLDLDGLSVTLDYPDNYSAKFDINVLVTPRRSGADALGPAEGFPLSRIECEYNADLYDPATIQRLMTHYLRVLDEAASSPDLPAADIPMLSAQERHEILAVWSGSGTDASAGPGGSLAQRFEQQVAANPEKPAACDGIQEVSYGALNERANRVARYLSSIGVSSQDYIGVCLERSIEMLVAVLAATKLGAAYVPLDAGYPAERLSFIASDASLKVILTDARSEPSLPRGIGTVVALDAEEAIDVQSGDDLAAAGAPDDAAYVMYTSGSTGQPKGVVVPQRGILRLVLDAAYCQILETDRVAHISSPSFDAATFEIWGALLNGATIVMLPRDTILSADALADQMREQGITVMFLTTALFNLVARERPDAFKSLRGLLFGGEAVDPRWVREILKAGRPGRLLHVYGPTETTTFAIAYEVTDVPAGAHTVPIGRPISRTTAYVLDPQMRPVPPGVHGELYIGGEGVALGYLNRPALTAEKFVRHPRLDEGDLLYRSGDLVRFLPDGNIEFVGRLDDQVKVRGFRVEPGEIEAVLASAPGVGACAVATHPDGLGNRLLVAYVSGRDGQEVSIVDLRSFLEQRLPSYMIPAHIVPLASIPLNRNGKLDRTALPAPEGVRADAPDFSAPATDTEQRLAEIWQKVLGVGPVSVTADFFALGGHSLLAAQLFWEIERSFGVRLPVSALFEAGTIGRLAPIVDSGAGDGRRPLVAMQPLGDRPPIYFMHSADRYGLNYRHLARHLGPDQPSYLLRPRDRQRSEAGDASIDEMARDAAEEIQAFQPEGPCFIVGHSTGGVVAFEVARILEAAGRELALVALLDTSCPADLYGFGSAVRRHLDALRRRNLTGKVDYVVTRGQARLSRLRRRRSDPALSDSSSVSLRAVAAYLPAPFGGRITFFWGDDEYPEHRFRADPRSRWRDFARGGLDVRRIPASHANMLTEPNVRLLAAELRRCIDEALEHGAGYEGRDVSASNGRKR